MADKRADRSRAVRRAEPRASTAARKAETRASVVAQGQFQTLRMTRKNWLLFAGGIVSILLGFILLAVGDITVAPILLLAGYLVLIPWSLVAASGGPRPGREYDAPKQG